MYVSYRLAPVAGCMGVCGVLTFSPSVTSKKTRYWNAGMNQRTPVTTVLAAWSMPSLRTLMATAKTTSHVKVWSCGAPSWLISCDSMSV